MSNHFHIVLAVDPGQVETWPNEEVVRRWQAVFPGALTRTEDEKQKERISLALRSDLERMQEIRARLGSLSWFMRALNEPIARWANKEDDRTRGRSIGVRFWRSERRARFVPPMRVDLNPVRAEMSDSLEGSAHTSVQARLKERANSRDAEATLSTRPLEPVAGLDADALLGMSETSYLELVK